MNDVIDSKLLVDEFGFSTPMLKETVETQKVFGKKTAYGKARECANPECHQQFRTVIGYKVGHTIIRRGGSPDYKKYCCIECRWRAAHLRKKPKV